MRSTYGYDSYRGRNRLQRVLMAVIIILLIILLLAVAAFFFLQKYMVYSDDGGAHLELPFFSRQEETVPTPSAPIVIVTPAPTPEPTPEPPIEPVALPVSAITAGAVEKQVEEAGGNAALFDMKPDSGTLRYVSALPKAISLRTSEADSELNKAIEKMNGTEGLYTIARVSCFRDDLAPYRDNSLALRSPLGNWRDPSNVRWMSPAVDETRAYVTGICRELAGLGFDEILLDNAAFPGKGNLDFLVVGERYDPEDLTGPVETFYREVAGALADYPEVKLSIAAPAEVLAGENDKTGQTRELLEGYAARLYTAESGQFVPFVPEG